MIFDGLKNEKMWVKGQLKILLYLCWTQIRTNVSTFVKCEIYYETESLISMLHHSLSIWKYEKEIYIETDQEKCQNASVTTIKSINKCEIDFLHSI